MAGMNIIEKVMVNSRVYLFFYRRTWFGAFLDFCQLEGKCLEIGTGPGYTASEFIRKFDIELTTMDFDPAEIVRAKKRLAGTAVVIRQGDAAEMPFKDGSFDCVVEASTLHHIAQWRKAIKEIHRVLKKGGSLFLMDQGMYFAWPFTLAMPFDPFDARFTIGMMVGELKRAGFTIVRKEGNDVFMIHAKKA